MSTFIEKLKLHPQLWEEHKVVSRAKVLTCVTKAMHELKVAARVLREIEEDKQCLIDAIDSLMSFEIAAPDEGAQTPRRAKEKKP